jgi:protein SCO1/2
MNVIYTSCTDECPLETMRMVQLQEILGDRVGKDIFFYSFTIDPKRDTPKALKAYAEKFGAKPGWLFLTGKEEDIKLLTRKLGLSKGREINRDNHSANLMIGNEPTGQWMRNSALDNPRFLAVTIKNFLGWRDATPEKSYAQAQPLVLDRGPYLFESLCSSCHTVGQGDKMGPDLLGVTTRRKRDWLTRYLLAPDQVLAAGDPIATALFDKYKSVMPNLRLASEDAAVLLSYLEARSSAPHGEARKDSMSAR